MPRRREVPKREVLPDSRYNSELVAKFVNVIMRDGKKSVAEGILYDAFDLIQQRTTDTPLEVFEKAVNNVKPVIEVKSRRVGGSTYQIPMEVRSTRRDGSGYEVDHELFTEPVGKEHVCQIGRRIIGCLQ